MIQKNEYEVCVSYLCRHDHRSQCYCLSYFYYSYVNVHDTSKFCTYVEGLSCFYYSYVNVHDTSKFCTYMES